MSIQQISPNSVAANPANVNPLVKTDQATATPQVNQNVQKTVQAIKTDTVTISKQALQLVSDGDSVAQEVKESASEYASEKLRGKK
jgi:hydrogenase maturation factor HypE